MVSLPWVGPPVLLELDLSHPLVEAEPEDPLGRLRSRGRPRLRPVLRTLYEAGADDRVRGLIVKIGGGITSWAQAAEIRDALVAFAAHRKPTVAWAESFAEAGNGTRSYFVATGCPQIWLQPSGELGLTGVASETTFLRGVLDNAGIEPQFDKRHEYKNAADRMMRREFTPEHREASDRIVESVWDDAVEAISGARRLSTEQVRAAADSAPLSAELARDAGLVDSLGYRDQVYAAVRSLVGPEAQLLFADRWSAPRRPAAALRRPRRRKVVALVEGYGAIVSGPGRRGPRGSQMGSDPVSAAFRAARDNDAVAAVLFRVDSPGGSAVASDTIWREVVLTREAGTPVIVSMGAVAGSGGYYVACGADAIVAQPQTLTGSIGVVGGKMVGAALLDRLGVGTGSVSRGAHALMYSPRQGFSDSDRERLSAMLDSVYDQFVDRVARGRGMSTAEVDAVARGRVWSGRDAHSRGLVDELGGLRTAARLARDRAGLPEDAPVRPAIHLSPLARLSRPRSSEDPRAASVRTGWGDLGGLAQALGLPTGGVLTMPDVRLV